MVIVNRMDTILTSRGTPVKDFMVDKNENPLYAVRDVKYTRKTACVALAAMSRPELSGAPLATQRCSVVSKYIKSMNDLGVFRVRILARWPWIE